MEADCSPVAGIDYPRDVQEFDRWFPSEESCRQYLYRARWPDGFRCPRCGSSVTPWSTGRGYLHCRDCEGETSLLSGTVFEGTHKPLLLWFKAMWLVTNQKHGVSALGLQRALGLGSYQTAWTWLHKLRRAMVRTSIDRLSGNVEIDETYVGGTEEGGKRGRGTENKDIVVIAVETNAPKGLGRTRMQRIENASADCLVPFIRDAVEVGATVLTDGWGGYNHVGDHGYIHDRVLVSKSGDPAHVLMPGVHRIAALLDRWLLGIHQGAVAGKHLDYYLDEFTFRFNRRKSRSRGMLFYRLLQQAAITATTSYHDLVRGAHHI
jgi:transposase-like protein